MKTGKKVTQRQSFHRQLLSEYNAMFTLERYVSYFELKQLIQEICLLQHKLESSSCLSESQQRISSKKSFLLGKSGNHHPSSAPSQHFASPLPRTAEGSSSAASPVSNSPRDEVALLDCFQEKFFNLLQLSFTNVKEFIVEKECDASDRIAQLKTRTIEDLKNAPEFEIVAVFRRVRNVAWTVVAATLSSGRRRFTQRMILSPTLRWPTPRLA